MTGIRLTQIALTIALLLAPLLVKPAYALLDEHDCSFCHTLHGAPGFSLLNETDVEVLCLSCHSTPINDTDAAAVHNPNNRDSDRVDYITCRECHDAHRNRNNVNGGTNIKLIGFRYDPVTGQRFDRAKIREENGDLGPYRDVVFEDQTDFNIDGNFPGLGACQVCHDPNHNQGQTCTECHNLGGKRHDHDWGFMTRDPN